MRPFSLPCAPRLTRCSGAPERLALTPSALPMRSRSLSVPCVRARARPTMAAAVELPCHRCSLAYSSPAPAPSLATHPSHHDAPPAPLFRSPRPPEHRRRQFRRAQATGFYGRTTTGRVGPSWAAQRVRTDPLVLPHHSPADDVPSPAATASSGHPLLCFSDQGRRARIRVKGRA